MQRRRPSGPRPCRGGRCLPEAWPREDSALRCTVAPRQCPSCTVAPRQCPSVRGRVGAMPLVHCRSQTASARCVQGPLALPWLLRGRLLQPSTNDAPVNSCPEAALRQPRTLTSRWIPRDRKLGRREKYRAFVAERRRLRAGTAKGFRAELYTRGIHSNVAPVPAGASHAAHPLTCWFAPGSSPPIRCHGDGARVFKELSTRLDTSLRPPSVARDRLANQRSAGAPRQVCETACAPRRPGIRCRTRSSLPHNRRRRSGL